MSSVVGKKRVSFDMYTEEIVVLQKKYPKVDQFPKDLYDMLFGINPVRVRSDSGDEMHIKKYIGMAKIEK
jgi:hypothetical protein